MDKSQQTQLSKFLSLVLRHKPETINLELDKNGWAKTADLIRKTNAHGIQITMEDLQIVVKENSKKRFAFSDDDSLIRASQGHSLQVNLVLKPMEPPAILYHGTAEKNIPSIKQNGLLKQSRQHVHLSDNQETAKQVGMRYGKPVVIEVKAKNMHQDGLPFYQSANGVWLTDYVPAKYFRY